MFPNWNPEDWYRASRQNAEKNAETLGKRAEHMLSRYREWLPKHSLEEITKRLSESNEARLKALPDLGKYPELRGMDALIRAEWEGLRDGAKLTPGAWAALCDGAFHYRRHILPKGGNAQAREKGSGKCSYIYFQDSDHGPLLANNLDSSRDEPFGEPSWPMVNEHLLFGGVSSGLFLDETSPEIFPAPVQKLLARYCRSLPEAVELLERYRDFWGPGNAIVVDRNHRIGLIEKSARRIAVRYAEGFGFITAMTAESPEFRAFLDDRRNASLEARGLAAPCDDTLYWDEADRRRELMKRLVREQSATPTLEGLRKIIQYRGPEGRVAYHADALRPGGPPTEYTLRTTIWLLREKRALWWAIDGDTPSFETTPKTVEFPGELPWG